MKDGKKWPKAALAAFAFALLGSTTANAASFDCAKASSPIDNAICASPKVSQLDSDLHDAYSKALAQTPDAEALKTAQRTWLKTTRNACQDEACLISVYQQRIAALSGSVATSPAIATPTTANNPTPSNTAAPITQQDTTAPTTQPTPTPVAEPTASTPEPTAAVPAAPTAQPVQLQQQASTAPVEPPKQSEGNASNNDTVNAVVGLLFVGAVVYGLVVLVRRKSKNSVDVAAKSSETKEVASAKIGGAANSIGERAKQFMSFWRKLSTTKKVVAIIGVLFVIGAITGKNGGSTYSSSSSFSGGSGQREQSMDQAERLEQAMYHLSNEPQCVGFKASFEEGIDKIKDMQEQLKNNRSYRFEDIGNQVSDGLIAAARFNRCLN